MTVEADIKTVLTAVCDRVYPDFAPDGTPEPFLTFQQVGGQAPTFLERAVPSKENARIQVSAWSPRRAESKALIKAAEAAMVAATTFEAKPLGATIALVDENTLSRGSSQDFTVWANR